MARLEVVNNQTHGQIRVAATRIIAECGQINVVSVIPREFPRLLAHYPIFYRKMGERGQFEPAALLGFARTENLFLAQGQWDAVYVPLQIQRQPFTLLPRQIDGPEGQKTTYEVGLDVANPGVQTLEGERLFLEDGQASGYLQTITSILSVLVSGASEALAFTGRLAELNLIEPVRIDVEFVDSTKLQLEGLFWIGEAALKALPAAQLAELRDRQFLEWMYFQIASTAQVAALVARKNRQLLSGAIAAQSAAQSGASAAQSGASAAQSGAGVAQSATSHPLVSSQPP